MHRDIIKEALLEAGKFNKGLTVVINGGLLYNISEAQFDEDRDCLIALQRNNDKKLYFDHISITCIEVIRKSG
jgi:hypothetical protein